MSPLYKQIFVWKRVNETQLVRYCCFEELSSGQYFVQNADFLSATPESASLAPLDRQLIELFAEEPPSARTQGYPSLPSAIAAHDAKFEHFFDEFT